MEKYAVIKIGSSQYTVKENDVVEVERQTKNIKPEVLLVSDGSKIETGSPVLKDASVKLSLVEEKRDRKLTVGRFKSKSRYHKKRGHRQHLSVFKVEKISLSGANEENEEKAAAAEKTSITSKVLEKSTKNTPEKVVGSAAKPVKTAKKPVAKKTVKENAGKKLTKKEAK